MSDDHRIALRGPAAADDRVSGRLFRDLLDILVEGSERAVRFKIDGRSTAKGQRPAWLESAADFSLLRTTEAGASTALIESRPLVDTMPGRFTQSQLFDDLDPTKSPIELFEDGLEDAIKGNRDSALFDLGLVRTFERFGSLLDQGIDEVELVNERALRIDRAVVERVGELERESPEPQRVRVAGRLDAIRYSDCRFTLVLRDGTYLNGTTLDLGQEILREFFGKQVVVTGTAVFRPSGSPLRIEADQLASASEREEKIWSTVPRPLLGLHPARQIREEQRAKGGLRELLGKWPGKEDDEQVRLALENMS